MTESEMEERREYLRSTVSAREVLSRHGITIRQGRCRGFCHDGKDFNMKIFRDGCQCFVCGKNMDIFEITMILNSCDFWTAFELLGGTEKVSFRASRIAKQAIKEREHRVNQQRENKLKLREITARIGAYRNIIKQEPPFSGAWCYAQDKLPYQLYLLDEYIERGCLPCKR